MSETAGRADLKNTRRLLVFRNEPGSQVTRGAPLPTSTSDIHLTGGTVTLSDGSRWQVGPGDLRTIAPWSPGRPAALVGPRLTREIRYEDDGSAALVCPA